MDNKRFLFVSIDALISDVAWTVAKEGHKVKYYVEDLGAKDCADGFVAKTDDWEREVEWADIIVFDDVLGHGSKAEALRKAGKLVIGGTTYSDKLEDDRKMFESHSKNAAILFKKRDRSGIHIEDVKCINGQWFVAGDSGVILVVVGMGQTVRQAQKEVYKRISNVMIPGMYYRTDVGNRWFEDCDKLHTWGYLREV